MEVVEDFSLHPPAVALPAHRNDSSV